MLQLAFVRVGASAVLRVYPNFAALSRYALFATDNRLSQMGVLQRRRRCVHGLSPVLQPLVHQRDV